MDRGLEPVVEARQGQHFSVPVGGTRQMLLLLLFLKINSKQVDLISPLIFCIKKATGHRHDSQKTENQLERQKLPEAFEDFQRGVKLKDGLAHRLAQSEALLLQSSAHSLHRYVYIISYLTGGEREVDSVKRSDTLQHKHDLKKISFIPASPAACKIC